MAEDDQDRAREMEAERRAEIESELERIDQDPDRVDDADESLGTQSAPSGTTRDAPGAEGEDEDEREEGDDLEPAVVPVEGSDEE